MLSNPLIFYVAIVALMAVVGFYAALKANESRLKAARSMIANGTEMELVSAEEPLNVVIRRARILRARNTEADALNDLGICQLLLKKPEKAKATFNSCLLLRRKTDVNQYTASLENLAAAFRLSGEYDRSITTFQEALAMVPSTDLTRKASILSNLGIAFRDKTDYVEAEKAFKQSLLIAREVGDGVKELVALSNLARFGRDMNLVTETKEFSAQAIPIAKSLNQREVESSLEDNLAWAFERTGDLDLARQHAQRSSDLKSSG